MKDQHAAPAPAKEIPVWIGWLAGSLWGVTVLSALESTVLPIPLEAVLLPVMVSHPKRAVAVGAAALVGCLIGSLLAYGAAMFLIDPVVMPVLSALGLERDFEEMQQRLTGEGLFWVVFAISITPAPIQLASLGAGAVAGNLAIFVAAVVLSRGPRYLGLGLLARLVGPRIMNLEIPVGRWTLILFLVILAAIFAFRLI